MQDAGHGKSCETDSREAQEHTGRKQEFRGEFGLFEEKDTHMKRDDEQNEWKQRDRIGSPLIGVYRNDRCPDRKREAPADDAASDQKESDKIVRLSVLQSELENAPKDCGEGDEPEVSVRFLSENSRKRYEQSRL